MTQTHTKLTIVIPCYNEAENIPIVLDRFAGALKRSDVRLLVVDNGSTDESAAILKRLIPSYSFAETIRVEKNQGYGFGILEGLRGARSDYIGWTHADMQTDPYDVIRALEILEASPENTYVKGLRKKRPLFDAFFTVGMGLFESAYLGAPLWDINAQPNIFPLSFFQSWDHPPHDFSLDLYALYTAKKRGLQVRRFDVVFPPRQHGHSKWNTGLASKWKFIKRTIDFSVRLKRGMK